MQFAAKSNKNRAESPNEVGGKGKPHPPSSTSTTTQRPGRRTTCGYVKSIYWCGSLEEEADAVEKDASIEGKDAAREVMDDKNWEGKAGGRPPKSKQGNSIGGKTLQLQYLIGKKFFPVYYGT